MQNFFVNSNYSSIPIWEVLLIFDIYIPSSDIPKQLFRDLTVHKRINKKANKMLLINPKNQTKTKQ